MAQRRMFSPDIVDSDAFLDMPSGSQLLYFHLAMRADDDGFVSPKKVMRTIGSTDDELKVLIAKRFVLVFESGVVVIKHWLIHNLIRADRYKSTLYVEEKAQIKVKENKAYTETTIGLQNDNQMATQVRLGKVRLGKVREERDEEITPDKPESSLSWLGTLDNQEKFHCGIPEETLQALSKKYKASVDQIKNKAEDLFMWCKTTRKVKKNYKMFLQVVLKRDFGSRTEHDIELQERIDRTKESIAAGSSPFAKSLAAKMKM